MPEVARQPTVVLNQFNPFRVFLYFALSRSQSPEPAPNTAL
jgi:hypothetical protein